MVQMLTAVDMQNDFLLHGNLVSEDRFAVLTVVEGWDAALRQGQRVILTADKHDLPSRDIAVTVVANATATFDAPEHPAEQVREQTLAHMAGILGATVERATAAAGA